MKNELKDIFVCVFAAGKGTRIREVSNNKPKLMLLINDKPMCSYIIERLIDIGFQKPNILVGYKAEEIEKYFGKKCAYITQKKRLGTGHAAKTVLKNIPNNYKHLLVLQGDDSAFYKENTLNKFIHDYLNNNPVNSFMVTESNDLTVGRVQEDSNGNIVKVVEKEEMLPEDYKKYKLINAAGYLFNINWMRKNISKLKKHMPKGEYYLPDLIKMAILEKKKVIGFKIPNNEWFGVNTPEQLKQANRLKLNEL